MGKAGEKQLNKVSELGLGSRQVWRLTPTSRASTYLSGLMSGEQICLPRSVTPSLRHRDLMQVLGSHRHPETLGARAREAPGLPSHPGYVLYARS